MKLQKIIIASIIAIFLIGAVILILPHEQNKMENTRVLLETNHGNITLEIYTEEMPITAGNFKKLVEDGFYDGVIFHRIIDGFMIQGGDPTGTGMGGPGYEIKDEFTETELDKNNRGTISMANAGPNTGGSQFFITVAETPWLDKHHAIFGKVIEGYEVVEAISKVDRDRNDKPMQDIVIKTVTVQ